MDYVSCCLKSCKREVDVFYFGKPICLQHWEKLSEKSVAEMKAILGIKEKSKIDIDKNAVT